MQLIFRTWKPKSPGPRSRERRTPVFSSHRATCTTYRKEAKAFTARYTFRVCVFKTSGATTAEKSNPAGSYRGAEVRDPAAAEGGPPTFRAGAGSGDGRLGTPPPTRRCQGEEAPRKKMVLLIAIQVYSLAYPPPWPLKPLAIPYRRIALRQPRTAECLSPARHLVFLELSSFPPARNQRNTAQTLPTVGTFRLHTHTHIPPAIFGFSLSFPPLLVFPPPAPTTHVSHADLRLDNGLDQPKRNGFAGRGTGARAQRAGSQAGPAGPLGGGGQRGTQGRARAGRCRRPRRTARRAGGGLEQPPRGPLRGPQQQQQ